MITLLKLQDENDPNLDLKIVRKLEGSHNRMQL